jgi:hypothetical protein
LRFATSNDGPPLDRWQSAPARVTMAGPILNL